MNAKNLSAIASKVATKAAARRLQVLNWTPAEIAADASTISGAVIDALAAAWPEAMADAQAAIDARMIDAATQTLEASFVLAGIEAANRHHAARRPEAVPA